MFKHPRNLRAAEKLDRSVLAPEDVLGSTVLAAIAPPDAADLAPGEEARDALTPLLAVAAEAAATYCNWRGADGEAPTFARNAYTETLRLTKPGTRLVLGLAPARVTALSCGGTFVPLDEIDPHEGTGIVEVERPLPAETKIVVSYDGGFVTPIQSRASDATSGPQLPHGIGQAITVIAQAILATNDREEFQVAALTETQDDIVSRMVRYTDASKQTGIPMEAQTLLAAYVRCF